MVRPSCRAMFDEEPLAVSINMHRRAFLTKHMACSLTGPPGGPAKMILHTRVKQRCGLRSTCDGACLDSIWTMYCKTCHTCLPCPSLKLAPRKVLQWFQSNCLLPRSNALASFIGKWLLTILGAWDNLATACGLGNEPAGRRSSGADALRACRVQLRVQCSYSFRILP